MEPVCSYWAVFGWWVGERAWGQFGPYMPFHLVWILTCGQWCNVASLRAGRDEIRFESGRVWRLHWQGEAGGPNSWETLEVTGEERMAWSKAVVRMKRPDE